MLYSTSPALCEIEEYFEQLKKCWDSEILTNNGPLLQEMEQTIQDTLKIKNYLAVTNGTVALKIALKALKIKGTIIIPAFSWIASVIPAIWNHSKIRFCDIEPDSLNLCLNSLQKNIDNTVEAIIPVHVFGNPCNVDKLEKIAKNNNLKLIYDAAHAFGTTINDKSVLSYGDISCISTHATKIFNTGEGGGLITNSYEVNEKIKSIRSFGFDKDKNVKIIGTNAKMTEMQAALGIANLKYFKATLEHRKKLNDIYRNELDGLKKISLQKINKGSNCSYFPLIFEDTELCQKAILKLEEKKIYPRRYFFPSLNKIKIFKENSTCPVSEYISERIICIPSHNKVSEKDVLKITRIIKNII